jgi:hypothetical protein
MGFCARRTRDCFAQTPPRQWLAASSDHRLPGNPAVCCRPHLGDNAMMTSNISRIIAPVILLLDARRGLSLAHQHRAKCHAIDNAGESPLADAPPFRDLHLKYAVSDLQRPLTQGPHTSFDLNPIKLRPSWRI